MTELFSLKTLISALEFHFNDFKWILYSDHVHSNFDKLDISISIYNRECQNSEFLINYYDPYTHNNRRVYVCKNFDQLADHLKAFENIYKKKYLENNQMSFIDFLLGSNAKA